MLAHALRIKGAAEWHATGYTMGDGTLPAANVAVASRGTLDATAPGVHTIEGGKINFNS